MTLFSVFNDALEGFEHQIELSDFCKIMGTAIGTSNVVVFHVGFHFFFFHRRGIDLALCKGIDQFIGSVTGLALFAVHQRITESLQMTGSFPNLGVHQNSRLDPHIVFIGLDEL